MKHILFFNDGLAMGGTEVLLVDLLNHLVNKDCKITLLLPQPSSKDVLLGQLSSNISVIYLYPENISHIKKKLWENIMIFCPRFFLKKKRIETSDYDMVVCFKETFFARIFSKMKLPKILWIHNILYRREYEVNSFRDKMSVWLNKIQLKKVQQSYNTFDKVICVSDAAKEAYLDILHDSCVPKQDIRILYNALDLSKVKEKAKQSIDETIPQDVQSFILITRTSPEKRIDRLVSAVSRLKSEGYRFLVHIIGEGMDSQAMKDDVSKMDIEDIVLLKERIENPFPYVLQSKWSLCVSERESFSLVLLESMAVGTPVITTNCGGPRNIVADGKYGLLVENSADGVYNGMKAVLDEPSLSVKYSERLGEAVARFDYNGWLKSVEQLLDI